MPDSLSWRLPFNCRLPRKTLGPCWPRPRPTGPAGAAVPRVGCRRSGPPHGRHPGVDGRRCHLRRPRQPAHPDPGPKDPPDLPRWYLASLDRALDVLGSADPGSGTWTFSSTGDRRVAWWNRRLAVEVAIHRWDAQDAVAADGGPSPDPLDGDVAAAGIEEFMTEFLPGLLAQESTGELSGTLHLHATDGPTEWWIDLEAAGRPCPGTSKRTRPFAAPARTFCCG